jgi:hypothetical protein
MMVAVEPQVQRQRRRLLRQRLERLHAGDEHPDDRGGKEEQQEDDPSAERDAGDRFGQPDDPTPDLFVGSTAGRLDDAGRPRVETKRRPGGRGCLGGLLLEGRDERWAATEAHDQDQETGGHDDREQEDRDGGSVAKADLREGDLVDSHRQHVRVATRTTAGQAVQQVEDLEADDHLQDADHDEGVLDPRQRDEAERLPGRGAVHLGGSIERFGDRLQRCQQQDDEERDGSPRLSEHSDGDRLRGVREPVERLVHQSEADQGPVHDPVVRVEDEPPEDPRHDGRHGPRQEERHEEDRDAAEPPVKGQRRHECEGQGEGGRHRRKEQGPRDGRHDLLVRRQPLEIVAQADERRQVVLLQLDPEQAEPEDGQRRRQDDQADQDQAGHGDEQGKSALAQAIEPARHAARATTQRRTGYRHASPASTVTMPGSPRPQ